MHEVFDQVLSYLKASWRYRWYAMILAWSISMIGWAVVYRLPDQYEASAQVHVDTQSILKPLLAGLAVQPNVDQMVSMMARTLMSRPNLEKVIRMADMDIKLKTPEEREGRINALSKQLKIGTAGSENLYVISYQNTNPVEAKRVVQSLLTIFVEGSLGDKRKDSDSARRFLDEQLKAHSEKLVAAENAVTEFKRKNMGLMPGQGGGYYERLGEAKSAVSQAELELKEAENARDAMKKQLSGENETPSLLDEKGGSNPAEPVNPELDARIQALQQKLDALRLTFTEQHPDILSAQRVIAQLKEQKTIEAKSRKSSPVGTAQNPVQQQLSVSLAAAEAGVASMKARVAEYTKRYEALKGAVNMLPQVDAEFAQLTRDHQVIRSNYEQLLARRESAQMGSEMEANASVVDFRVIDPPQVPSTPSAPNRRILMSMVLLGALGGGLALAFLLSQLRPTFTDERRLRELSGLPVFGTVVMAWGPVEMAKRRKRLLAFLVSLVSLFSAYGAIIATLALTGKG
jgi:protein tyrosine kinase modulator